MDDKIIDNRSLLNQLINVAHWNDCTTLNHVLRVATYVAIMVRDTDIDPLHQRKLYYAAALHDTGKLLIPKTIIDSRQPFDDDMRKIMQTHTTHGRDLFSGNDTQLFRLASDIAEHHHERIDGTGYPHGLKGDEISLAARITAICDVFDALSTERTYKPAWHIDNSMNYLVSGGGTQFDAQLVDVFIKNFDSILCVHERWTVTTKFSDFFLKTC